MQANSLTPKLRAAVCAAHASPGQRLLRCPGGYTPANPIAGDTITRRVVNMLERDYILRYEGPMHATAVLTTKGERLADELVKAGAK
jgi:hypothetical protein